MKVQAGFIHRNAWNVNSREFCIAPVQASMGLRWYDAGDMDE